MADELDFDMGDEDAVMAELEGPSESPASTPDFDPVSTEEVASPSISEAPATEVTATTAPPAAPAAAAADDGDDLGSFMATAGLATQGHTNTRVALDKLIKPWMRFHKFTLVKTVEEVHDIVDKALKHGRCALDLETEGFDNRIVYHPDGRIETVHKIVGYCISVRGEGYYIPVRHKFDSNYGERDPNVPVDQVDAEIRRLCQASQPVATEKGLADDPVAPIELVSPPKVVIYFWNAKFDQEFLFPVTGIDYWHPLSFEDGMLAVYVYYTDDILGLKENSAQRLSVFDPDPALRNEKGELTTSYPYEMIKFEELFPPGLPRGALKFANLYPADGEPMVFYGCSDAICTEILCEAKKVTWAFAQNPAKVSYKDTLSPIAKSMSIYKLEKQAAQAVRIMERARAKIDVTAIKGLLEEAHEELALYEQKIQRLAAANGFPEFNPGSTAQLSEFLFGKNGLDINPKPAQNVASKQYKTDAATLEKMFEEHPDIEVLEWIVKFRQIDKIIGTYLTSLSNNCDADGQLRFKFHQTGAATGRFTAPAGEADHGYGGIPIQGIPARSNPKKPKVAHSLRRMFVARTGYTLVKIDYAGQELRIVTNLSKEPVWVKEFKEGTGDLHTITAQAFFGPHITKESKAERDMGKVANFSLIYGGGSSAIMRATKCDKVEAARRKANFDKSVPVFAEWVKKQHDSVKKALGVYTAFGRFIRIPDANLSGEEHFQQTLLKMQSKGMTVDAKALRSECESDAKRIRAGCERKATNFPIQGSGADILKISLVRLVRELTKRKWLRTGGDDSVRMIMTVHDEIVFEIKHERLMEAMPVIVEVMESPAKIAKWDIPLVVEPLIGLTWEAKYDWEQIISGKKPVPDWLEGYVVPGQHHPRPDLSTPSVPQTATPTTSAPQVSSVAAPVAPSLPVVASKPQGKIGRIVVFTLPFLLLKESVNGVRVALVKATPVGMDPVREGARLRLLDQYGATLIDPATGICVIPEKFSEALREYNLGPGTFQYED